MTNYKYTYNTILAKANTVTKNVQTTYKIGMTHKWSYYFAKALQTHKDVTKIKIEDAPKPSHTHISRQATNKQYLTLAKKLTDFIEKKHRLPNYLTWNNYHISSSLYTYTFARCLVYYNKYGKYDPEITINQKVFTKPTETKNQVYNHFIDVFGEFGNTIDGALTKVNGKGYAYYYDDIYSNQTSIDRIKQGKGINCTDSCQVFMNIGQQLVNQGKYKKIECLHVQCSSGGHVKLKITKNDGSTFIRDPACVLSDNGKPITCTWCTNTGVINPSWFMENLNR